MSEVVGLYLLAVLLGVLADGISGFNGAIDVFEGWMLLVSFFLDACRRRSFLSFDIAELPVMG